MTTFYLIAVRHIYNIWHILGARRWINLLKLDFFFNAAFDIYRVFLLSHSTECQVVHGGLILWLPSLQKPVHKRIRSFCTGKKVKKKFGLFAHIHNVFFFCVLLVRKISLSEKSFLCLNTFDFLGKNLENHQPVPSTYKKNGGGLRLRSQTQGYTTYYRQVQFLAECSKNQLCSSSCNFFAAKRKVVAILVSGTMVKVIYISLERARQPHLVYTRCKGRETNFFSPFASLGWDPQKAEIEWNKGARKK